MITYFDYKTIWEEINQYFLKLGKYQNIDNSVDIYMVSSYDESAVNFNILS